MPATASSACGGSSSAAARCRSRRGDGVDGDPTGPEFPRRDGGQLLDRALAGGVGGDAGRGPHGVEGGDVHDPAPVAHPPGGVAHREEDRPGVDRHDRVEDLHVGRGERGRREGRRGVVHEDAQTAEMLLGGFHQPLGRTLFAEVDVHRLDRAAVGLHGTDDRLRGALVLDVGEHHGRPVPAQPLNDGPPDTPGPAGDDGGRILQHRVLHTRVTTPGLRTYSGRRPAHRAFAVRDTRPGHRRPAARATGRLVSAGTPSDHADHARRTRVTTAPPGDRLTPRSNSPTPRSGCVSRVSS